MKSKILVLIAATFMLFSISVTAQIPIEVKLNPIGTIFGDPDLSVEFLINDNFGIEPTFIVSTGKIGINDISYDRTGFGGMVATKYYFNPIRGGDRFNVGLYGKFKNNSYKILGETQASTNRAAAGLIIGSKFVSQSNILFEFAFGVGRSYNFDSSGDQAVINNLVPIDLVARLALGYRFGSRDVAPDMSQNRLQKKKKKARKKKKKRKKRRRR